MDVSLSKEARAAQIIASWSASMAMDMKIADFKQISALGKPIGDMSFGEIGRLGEAISGAFGNIDSDELLGEQRERILECNMYLCRDDLQDDAIQKLKDIVGAETLAHWLTASVMISNMRTNTKDELGASYIPRHKAMMTAIGAPLSIKKAKRASKSK